MTRIHVSEETLVAALSGNAGAIDTIVRALQQPFLDLARRMILDRSEAEDATQEALLRVVTHLSQFDHRAQFSTWAWRIAIRQCLDHRRKRYRLSLLTDAAIAVDLADGLDSSAPERPDDAYLLEQVKFGCGVAMLSILDGDHRAAYVLGKILELSSEEGAAVLEIDPAAFRKRVSRASARILETLSRHCGVVDPANPCRCHRRLGRAQALERVAPDPAAVSRLDLPALRARLASIPALERAVAFYRADPEATTARGFADEVRRLLSASQLA